MAKIIAAEKLKLDAVEMKAANSKLVFNSKTQADEDDVSSIDTRVSTEESTRGAADTSLTTRVSTEESARGAADTSLTTRVSTEESTRSSADASLTTRMDAENLTTQVSTFAIGNGANYLTIDYSAFNYGA